ncbi:MAG: hypothetical protein WC877_06385, partial [Dehalococcoidales bacterium]
PWWTAYVVALDVNAVEIFPHGIASYVPGEYESWIAGYDDVMPGWFTPFMWVYFGAILLALLISIIISDQKRVSLGKISMSLPTALVAAVGISYIIVVIAAVTVISLNIQEFFDTPLQGSIFLQLQEGKESIVRTALSTHYWVAVAAGPVLLILSILRRFIVG